MRTKTLLGFVGAVALAGSLNAQMLITGIGDGPLSGGTPKFLEIYVTSDIADLSLWDIQNYNNGNTSPTTTFTLSGSATAGSFLYIATEATNFTSFFGFAPTFTSSVLNVNGDDAVALRLNTTIVDVYGVIGVDGSGMDWDYLDGWAYRVSGTTASSTFVESSWVFSGVDALDGASTNATAANPVPIGTFVPIPEPGTVALVGIGLTGLLWGMRRRRVA